MQMRAAPPTLAEAARFWFRLGCVSFGGPAGQIALLHDEVVTRRRWIGERRFLHALNYCMVLPGPEAQQLATYIGWLMHGRLGGVIAGALFVLPSLALMIGLGWVYMTHGTLPAVAGVLTGLKPVVVAVVLHAAWKLGRRTLRHPLAMVVAGAAPLAFHAAQVPFAAVLLAAAATGWLSARTGSQAFGASQAAAAHASTTGAWRRGADAERAPWLGDEDLPPAHAAHPRRTLVLGLAAGVLLVGATLAAVRAWAGAGSLPAAMAAFFTKAALLTFGGAYAVLPYVMQAAVHSHHWITAPQMLDGLALGETTPGPLIMVVAFVAYVGGWQGAGAGAVPGVPPAAAAACCAVLVTWVTFLPSFVFILTGAPMVEASRSSPRLAAPLAAVGAAVVGLMAALGLWLGVQIVLGTGAAAGHANGHPFGWPFDALTMAAIVAAGAALLRGWGIVPLLAAGAACGIARAALGV